MNGDNLKDIIHIWLLVTCSEVIFLALCSKQEIFYCKINKEFVEIGAFFAMWNKSTWPVSLFLWWERIMFCLLVKKTCDKYDNNQVYEYWLTRQQRTRFSLFLAVYKMVLESLISVKFLSVLRTFTHFMSKSVSNFYQCQNRWNSRK